jgi:hypothetical protein
VKQQKIKDAVRKIDHIFIRRKPANVLPRRELVASHITFFRALFPLDLLLLFLLLIR